MNLKRFFSMVLILVFALSLAACSGKPAKDPSDSSGNGADAVTKDPVSMRVFPLSGPTGLGMAKLMADSDDKKTENAYQFEVYDSPEALLPQITSGNYEIAALPTNVAAKLYQKTNGALQILAVNTLGVLYVLEIGTETVHSVADLKGKTVYTTGQGSTPEYALRYLLEKNGLNPDTDVEIVYEATADEVVAHAASGAVMMLPEPKVTAVKSQVEGIRVALDVSAEWDKISDTPLVQGCVVVNRKFAQENPAAVAAFLKEYEASISYVSQNPADASVFVAKYGIMPKAPLAEKAIPNSNLVFLAGSEMKATLDNFYQVLFKADPSSVGGALPDSGFYYAN